jgi:glycosyltransferase involved in cell wall biosynthesis
MSVEHRPLTGRAPLVVGPSTRTAPSERVRVLFFVEGFTDIRFVVGLSQISDLTMVVPSQAYRQSHLIDRVAESHATLRVVEIPGGRLRFQLESMRVLRRLVDECDLILVQELLRGALNANIVGRLRRTPVVAYMGISPLEYFRCRRERGQIGAITALLGSAAIRGLVAVNGRLSTRCLGMGPYLRDVAARWCPRSEIGLYYGIDVELFRPAEPDERARLRQHLDLPRDKFLIVLASRISHEKDPETVLEAVALARARGLDAVLLNLGGGHRKFLALSSRLGIRDAAMWTIGREAVHPMRDLADYLRTADLVVQASLAEGAAYSTLEALACGTPVVATAVGGMAVQLRGYASLTPRRDAAAMAEAFLSVAADPVAARGRAMAGRDYVRREWNHEKAFRDLAVVLASVAKNRVFNSS